MKRTLLTTILLAATATLFAEQTKITVIQTTDIHGSQRFASLAGLIVRERESLVQYQCARRLYELSGREIPGENTQRMMRGR